MQKKVPFLAHVLSDVLKICRFLRTLKFEQSHQWPSKFPHYKSKRNQSQHAKPFYLRLLPRG
jgi:hypothetical protein